jgi:hypothetical protein
MKWLVGIVLVFLLLLGTLFFFVDRIVAGAIEQGGEYALGVETDVGFVSVRPIAGRFGLGGLTVSNPDGFETSHFLQLEGGELELRLRSLTDDPIVIPRLELRGIHLNLEQRQGQTNYGIILDHIGGFESSGDDVAEQGATNVVLEEVVIGDVAAHVQLLPVAGKLSAVDIEVPDIRLQNIGSGGEGVPQILAVLTRAVLESVVSQSGNAAFAGDLRGRLEGVEEMGTRALEGIKGLIPRRD